jgi:signal transduction histidine kinase
MERPRFSAPVIAASVAALGIAVTVCVMLLPQVRFGYRAAGVHIAVETAAVLIALLIALLALGRFRRNGGLADLLLTATFALLALVNLVFSTIPAIVSDVPSTSATWGALGGRVVGAGLLAAAAVMPDRRMPPRRAVGWLLACVGAGMVVATGLAAASDLLPEPVDPVPSPSVGVPGLNASPLIILLQLVSVLAFAVASVGYLRQTRTVADPLHAGLGIGAVLAGCSAMNYALFPSLFSDWIYVGDVFRLVAYLVFLTAAFREIGTYWTAQNQLAVLEERQRLARDLHDGLAQELAYILRHAMRLPGDDDSALRIREAARRALAESRHAIHALSTANGSLDEAIADAVARSAVRTHIAVDLDLDPGVAAEADQREALARIAAEAVANAGQHADVDEVRVRLDAGPPLRLRISDTGRGFNPVQPSEPNDGFGLYGMTRRARDIGADLHVTSAPGRGTVVEVRL